MWNLQLKAVCNCTHSARIEYVWIEAEMFSMASQFSEKKLEMDILSQQLPTLSRMTTAVANSQQDDNSEPEVQTLQNPPSQEEQDKHNLTRCSYQPWFPACIKFQVRADAHKILE